MNGFDWKAEYERINTGFSTKDGRPLIGITGNFDNSSCCLAEGYFLSVLNAGGIPVILPPYEETDTLCGLLDRLDGIIFSGGGDINPPLLDEMPSVKLHSVCHLRDVQELLLARLAYDRQIPMLGICKGIQILMAALGGKIYQDIYSQAEGTLMKHSQDLERSYPSHSVNIVPGSVLHGIFRAEQIAVNSFHHQAVMTPAPGFRVSATSEDGIIEAVESVEHKSIIGVQWHPECLRPETDKTNINGQGKPLFRWLIEEAVSFKNAKRIHERILTLDSHCDTPMMFHKNIDFASRDKNVLVDLHKMTEGRLDATIMVAYLKQLERDEESLLNATAKANRILSQIEEMAAKNCTAVDIAYTPEDIIRLKHEGKKAIMLGIENAYAIGKDIRNVEKFRKRGVVYMTLCHNGDNDVCDSARGNAEHGGLSAFGIEVVKEMNRTGMLVDLSHAAESSFYHALEVSSVPIVCSHSSARALCDHPRNLTDEQMKALARKGGVAQVTLYNGFLRTDGKATIIDAIDHLNHMVNIMGIDHVGIGTDFDGDGGIPGCASASELINFTRHLLKERYSEQDISKIWGGNFLRVMKEANLSF